MSSSERSDGPEALRERVAKAGGEAYESVLHGSRALKWKEMSTFAVDHEAWFAVADAVLALLRAEGWGPRD